MFNKTYKNYLNNILDNETVACYSITDSNKLDNSLNYKKNISNNSLSNSNYMHNNLEESITELEKNNNILILDSNLCCNYSKYIFDNFNIEDILGGVSLNDLKDINYFSCFTKDNLLDSITYLVNTIEEFNNIYNNSLEKLNNYINIYNIIKTKYLEIKEQLQHIKKDIFNKNCLIEYYSNYIEELKEYFLNSNYCNMCKDNVNFKDIKKYSSIDSSKNSSISKDRAINNSYYKTASFKKNKNNINNELSNNSSLHNYITNESKSINYNKNNEVLLINKSLKELLDIKQGEINKLIIDNFKYTKINNKINRKNINCNNNLTTRYSNKSNNNYYYSSKSCNDIFYKLLYNNNKNNIVINNKSNTSNINRLSKLNKNIYIAKSETKYNKDKLLNKRRLTFNKNSKINNSNILKKLKLNKLITKKVSKNILNIKSCRSNNKENKSLKFSNYSDNGYMIKNRFMHLSIDNKISIQLLSSLKKSSVIINNNNNNSLYLENILNSSSMCNSIDNNSYYNLNKKIKSIKESQINIQKNHLSNVKRKTNSLNKRNNPTFKISINNINNITNLQPFVKKVSTLRYDNTSRIFNYNNIYNNLKKITNFKDDILQNTSRNKNNCILEYNNLNKRNSVAFKCFNQLENILKKNYINKSSKYLFKNNLCVIDRQDQFTISKKYENNIFYRNSRLNTRLNEANDIYKKYLFNSYI